MANSELRFQSVARIVRLKTRVTRTYCLWKALTSSTCRAAEYRGNVFSLIDEIFDEHSIEKRARSSESVTDFPSIHTFPRFLPPGLKIPWPDKSFLVFGRKRANTFRSCSQWVFHRRWSTDHRCCNKALNCVSASFSTLLSFSWTSKHYFLFFLEEKLMKLLFVSFPP